MSLYSFLFVFRTLSLLAINIVSNSTLIEVSYIYIKPTMNNSIIYKRFGVFYSYILLGYYVISLVL